MGERVLVSHMKGKKHIQRMQDSSQPKPNSFFQSNLKASKEQSTVNVTVQSSSKTMDNFVYDDKSVTNAEIIWTLKNVQANFLLKSCESLPKVFQEMFPDSVIAKNFTFSKDKCSYYINYGVGPCYKSVLTNEIKASPYYSTSFDETLNKVTQQEQMDIYVTF